MSRNHLIVRPCRRTNFSERGANLAGMSGGKFVVGQHFQPLGKAFDNLQVSLELT